MNNQVIWTKKPIEGFCLSCKCELTISNIKKKKDKRSLYCILCHPLNKRQALKKRRIEKCPFCPYCNCVLTMKNSSRDHMIPRIRGGNNKENNCVTCCISCNNKKGKLMPLEYMFGCGFADVYVKSNLVGVIVFPFSYT